MRWRCKGERSGVAGWCCISGGAHYQKQANIKEGASESQTIDKIVPQLQDKVFNRISGFYSIKQIIGPQPVSMLHLIPFTRLNTGAKQLQARVVPGKRGFLSYNALRNVTINMKYHPDLLCSTSLESTISDIGALLPSILLFSSKKIKNKKP